MKYIEDRSKRRKLNDFDKTLDVFQRKDGRLSATFEGLYLGIDRRLQKQAQEISKLPENQRHAAMLNLLENIDVVYLVQCDELGAPAKYIDSNGSIQEDQFKWCLVLREEIEQNHEVKHRSTSLITNANFKKIFKDYYCIDTEDQSDFIWENELRDIIDNKDIQRIRSFVSFCKDPQGFVSLRVYHGDTFEWLNETAPKYHKSKDCDWLHKDFFGIKLPKAISLKGKLQKDQGVDSSINVVNVFRQKYCQFNLHRMVRLYHNNTKAQEDTSAISEELQETITRFVEEWNKHYDPRLSKDDIWTDVVESSNSGSTNIFDGDLDSLKREIDQQINDLKALLKRVLETKRCLIDQIENYYIIESNPERRWDTTWLESLGFEPCGACYPERNNNILLTL